MANVIFFVGAGNMGGAILRGLVAAGHEASGILFYEPFDATAEAVAKLGAVRVASFAEGYKRADVIFLCVKPQVFAGLPAAWKRELGVAETEALPGLGGKRFVSIMAGVTRAKILAGVGEGEVLRVMPNLPLTVGKGTVALATDGVSEETLQLAEGIFQTVGTTCRVQEAWMDAVTGLSGSGPAYVFEFVEGLVRGGVRMGLTRAAAMQLALGTVEGSIELLRSTGKSPSDLCAMVSSPGGTTIAGVLALEEASFRAALMSAVEKATLRSKELG